MTRAQPGSEVTVVIAINGDDERTQVFSTPATAQAWMDSLGEDWTSICIETMVVDVPEFGNEAQNPAG